LGEKEFLCRIQDGSTFGRILWAATGGWG
jgi:hypothetical protein